MQDHDELDEAQLENVAGGVSNLKQDEKLVHEEGVLEKKIANLSALDKAGDLSAKGENLLKSDEALLKKLESGHSQGSSPKEPVGWNKVPNSPELTKSIIG